MAATKKGVWDLQEVRDKQLQSEWGYEGYAAGYLFSWGSNPYGVLGQNNPTPTIRLSATESIGSGIPGTDNLWTDMFSGVEVQYTGATKTDGTMWMWGRNYAGQLGNNEGGPGAPNRSSPCQIPGTTWAFRDDSYNGNDKSKMCMGQGASFGIKTDGTLWGWGENQAGQLGQSSDKNKRSSPTQIPGSWSVINIVKDSGVYGIRTNGELWCWGYNQGYLGMNDNTEYSSPVQIAGGGTNWRSVGGVGNRQQVATKVDGTLWTWGGGSDGQLGINSRADKNSPCQVGTDTTWRLGTTGDEFTMATKVDGTLWAMGLNHKGQLGLNFIGSGPGSPANHGISSPVQVGSSNTWDSIVAFKGNACLASKTDGTIWSWGYAGGGALGQGNPGNAAFSSPNQIGTASTWTGKLSSAGQTAMALKS